MRRSRNANGRFPTMRHDRKPAIARVHGNAFGLGEAADPADIGLNHIDGFGVHELQEFEARVLPFAKRDLDRRGLTELGIAFDIIRWQRRLDKVDVFLREHLDGAQRLLPIPPGIGHVDHQNHLGPTALRMSRTMRAHSRSSSI